jgi:hypothetical protein
MRLIDADALWEIFREKQNSLTARCGGYRFLDGEDRAKYDRLENTLAYIENAPEVDAVPVVRCVECIWWQDRQVQLIDGSCRDYMPDEPWSVTCDVGINVGSHCTKHGFDDESGSWFWAAANDYCSRGEREGTMTK